MKLTDYIVEKPKALTKSKCDALIEKFELYSSHHINSGQYIDGKQVSNEFRCGKELNITNYYDNDSDAEWCNFHDHITDRVQYLAHGYAQEMNITQNMWPPTFSFEGIRIKKYDNNGKDQFDFHVDIDSYKNSKRFLAIFFYLNDVDEGGETEFGQLNTKVKPEVGKCLLFPPTWQYLHAGLKPISNPKYIIGTYLHYM